MSGSLEKKKVNSKTNIKIKNMKEVNMENKKYNVKNNNNVTSLNENISPEEIQEISKITNKYDEKFIIKVLEYCNFDKELAINKILDGISFGK